MNIDIFSDCMFTRGAFEFLAHQLKTDMHIAIFDVGLYIDNYHSYISTKKYDFVIVLSARNTPPFSISGKIILLSKLTPLKIMLKIINSYLFNRCEFSQIILTSRERLYYKYWLEGKTTTAIAITMSESTKTVSNIKQSIYRKYDTNDLYIFMLIMKISKINGNVDCRHYKLSDGVEIKNHILKSVKNVQIDDDVNATMHVDFYSSA
ncbi:LuxR C-terminal-related transcriptional regulator [Pectobacterium polonicum]|uniref:LuxR C-terminal-related transcriptional regulator n=1 Tax=Pectobacterium polonicum TaxID=2485124 RepID=A0AAE9T1W0_9GAMM|nr:LuxR C-terminal-related transcriptional regulator [Pectobacterium polonicum]UVO07464.1 LuxR C-terminal-related transcriptional regulator [Pectobacterium polonicum]